jgi:excisionase family DNA binding protein
MAQKTDALTTKQFSEITGMPVSTVTRLIRDGRIKAQKKSGRWMISKDQLSATAGDAPAVKSSAPDRKTPAAVSPKQDTPAPAAKPPKAAHPGSQTKKSLDISEFAALTYLTEYGVTQWLTKGRLTGRQDENGIWQVDASNLDHPHIKRLLR